MALSDKQGVGVKVQEEGEEGEEESSQRREVLEQTLPLMLKCCGGV